MTYNEIYLLRIENKISQIKLAEHSGYTPAMISNWELQKSEPSTEQVANLYETISNIILKKEKFGIDIRKKRIQHSGKIKEKSPSIIKSIEDYKKRMEKVTYHRTLYSDLIKNMQQISSCLNRKNAPKAIALFSGCGGMTLGFDWSGFNVLGHVEIDDTANIIYNANFPKSKLLGKDIEKISDIEVRSWINSFGNIDVIIGGPPCQGFSLAGKRNPEDERNELFKHYIRIVNIIRPKVFVMENVRLMTSMKDKNGRLFIDRIINECRSIGYNVKYKNVNAQDFGVPQFRERVLIIGTDLSQNINDIEFPTPTHTNQNQISLLNADSQTIRTFRDAVGDLPLLESGEKSVDPLHWAISHPLHVIKWLKDVPEGHSAHENENPELRPLSGFNTTYKRLVWDEPCSTISTNFNMISGCRNVHPTSTRSLTIREATRAQSFPDQFYFFGKWGDIRRVIGNAVPPLLAKVIADKIKVQLFKQ